MQDLRFIITGQMIKKAPDSPFNKMVAGTSHFYAAVFEMDRAWAGYSCLAHFEASGHEEYIPIVNGKAIIPDRILEYKTFDVSVVGQKDAARLTTNKTTVRQIGGK